MNGLWLRLLRPAYRKDPIISFVVTVGVVDAAMGGLSQRWSLLTVGLGTVGTAIALYWWQQRGRRSLDRLDRSPVFSLPPQSSRPSLPALDTVRKIPPSNPPK